MENKNNIDILSELENLEKKYHFTIEDIVEEKKKTQGELSGKDKRGYSEVNTIEQDTIDTIENKIVEKKKKKGIINLFFKNITFLFKYLATSTLIFAVLLVTTNYSAYIEIAMSYVNQDKINENRQLLISSVKASYIQEKIVEKKKEVMKKDEKHSNLYKRDTRGIKKLINNKTNRNLNLDIDVTPYENRLIVPRIGKNVPLIDIKQKSVSTGKELENIFMEELKDGVVRYPGTAKPGERGNSFIFGHSSNFPWVKGDYNEVFALIDNIVYGDKIIVYYGQKKYTYIVREKRIISPNDVSLLKRDKNKSEITLMACWPIGTTLNRIIVIGELIEE